MMRSKALLATVLPLVLGLSAPVAVFQAAPAVGQAPPPASAQAPADVVFRNGDVYTMDPQRPWARGVAVRGARIVAVADAGELPAGLIGPKTRVVELGGRMLLPGFIDGHVHFNQAGALMTSTS